VAVRTALIQLSVATDAETNMIALSPLIADAAGAGATLVVLPEAAMHDFGSASLELGPVAQARNGLFGTFLAEQARVHAITIVAGMFEQSDNSSRPFNTLLVASHDDGLTHHYRKAHLYDSFGYRESDRLSPGDAKPVTVRLGDLTLGLMTCYDLRFPEFGRALVDAGADVLVVPAAWVRGPLKEDHWTTLLRARAIENTAYVLGAAQTGPTYVGCSAVVDPLGVVVASAGDEETVVLGDITPERLADVRRRNPSLANRRSSQAR
jgi:predicted amidohydrolase